MAFTWNSELINALSNEDLRQLLANASAKGNEEVCSLCREELELRKPKPKPRPGLPEGFVKIARSALGRRLELDAVDLLVSFAAKLETQFDLSTEKARALSGSKGFTAHKLTDAKGGAKVGGAQKQGLVVFDRYISYRLGREVFALLAVLPEGDQVASVRYQVSGPAKFLTNARPLHEVRPYLPKESSFGLIVRLEDFGSFQEAADRFMFQMEQIAPKRQQRVS